MKSVLGFMFIAAVALCGLIVAPKAGHANDAQALMKKWDAEDERCRGGRGDDPKTEVACERRERTYAAVQKLGWCYGEDDQPTAAWQWHRCRKRQR